MTTTTVQPVHHLTDLVEAVRCVVAAHADWDDTAERVTTSCARTSRPRRCSPPSSGSARRTTTAATPSTSSPTARSRSSRSSGVPARRPDPRPRHLVRLRRRPGRRARGALRRRPQPGRRERQPRRRRQRLRAAGRHPPRPQHRRHHRDLDPRLRHRRHPHRLQRPPLLRLTRGGRPMSQTFVHQFTVSLDGFGTGEGQTRGRAVGSSRRAPAPVDVQDPLVEVTWQRERRWHRRRLPATARARGSAPRSWAPTSWAPGVAGGPRLEGLVGTQPAVPHPGLRPHPSPALVDRDGGRDDVPLPRRLPGRGARGRQRAAGDLDVRIGGGATVIRDFFTAGLVDHAHMVVVPILLGRGVRLWDGLRSLRGPVPSRRSPHRAASPT